jgi:tetratricopeptide (TPR) repeat protein
MGAAAVSVSQGAGSRVERNRASGLAKRPLAMAVLLFVATVALYYPVHNHPFINYDDRDYVYENPHVQAGLTVSTVAWAFTTYHAGNWHPLTWLSHAIDCQFFGLNPAGHHDMNVLLHAFNAVLLFWVLWRATGFAGRSFMAAALFALHPINVESVAWVAERKNLLCTMFFLLALGAYRWYVQQPRVGRYAAVAALFALGLMAKPQIITLPFVLLLWDYWPLRRIFPATSRSSGQPDASPTMKRVAWLAVEKLPLLAMAAVSGAITMKAQHAARNYFPRAERLGNAVLSYSLYLKNAIWPTKLALLYPHPGNSLSLVSVALSGAMLLAVTALVIAGRRHRYLPVGWFWFVGTLVPMLGLVQVGVQAMADRYAYVSLIGLFIMATWGVAECAERIAAPTLLPGVSLVCLLLLAGVARKQIGYWQTDETLWSHTLRVTRANWIAESQLGAALAIEGKVAQALPHFYNALALNPDEANSSMGIAIYDMRQKNYPDALQHLQVAIRDTQARPGFLRQAYQEMARSYQALGDTAKAQECLEKARAIANP